MLDMQRQRLELLVKQGAKPEIMLDVSNRFTGAPISAENVVGEIEGAVHPEQIVLVAAHLDSWDLSPGATDDGTGVAAVIAAARAIHAAGVRPDRTIRFVLFILHHQQSGWQMWSRDLAPPSRRLKMNKHSAQSEAFYRCLEYGLTSEAAFVR